MEKLYSKLFLYFSIAVLNVSTQDINECASGPCKHGGICTDKVNGYTCTCVTGYVGVHCEININECASGPCKHRGTCKDNVNGYTCSCAPGYNGVHCERGPPTVTIPQSSYSVIIGRSVTLTCNVISDLDITSVTWRRTTENNSEPLFITVLSGEISSSKYSGSNSSSPSLTISYADKQDQGAYTCIATNEDGTGNSSATFLVVRGPPTVTIPQSSYSVIIGRSVTLTCNVISDLDITSVTWRRTTENNSEPLFITVLSGEISSSKYSGSNSSSPSLTISYADKQDQGAYTCIATNEDGTGNSSATFLVVRGPPTVTIPQSSYSIIIGRSVTLACNVISDLDITSVTWRRTTENNSEPLFITVLSGEISSSKYSGSNSSSPSLTISYADKQDQGAYTCIATNEDGTGNSSATFLVVRGPPTVTIPQSSYSVIIGSSVTLTCNVTSDLDITSVTWRRTTENNSEPLFITVLSGEISSSKYSGSNSSSPSLTISYADKQDQGAYTCIATNEDGTGNSSAAFLIVRGPPTVTIPQSSYSVIIGSSVTLTCNVASDLDIISVTWRRTTENNSEPLFITVLSGEISSSKYSGSNSSSPSLTISYVDKQDQGAYTCIATNEDGTGNSSATFLIVRGPPTVTIPQSSYSVIIGSSVTLTCNVTSDLDIISVTWRRTTENNSEPLFITVLSGEISSSKYSGSNSSSPSLTISYVDKQDQGAYTCIATNEDGTGNSSATFLIVRGPPTVTIPQSSYSVIIGRSVTLTCNVTSDLYITSVTWLRITENNSEPLFITVLPGEISSSKYSGSNSSSPSLTISYADKQDQGAYTCIATNEDGTGNSSATFLVVRGPPTVTIPQSSYSVIIGRSVTLTCNVTSDLYITSVTWLRITENNSEPLFITVLPGEISSSKYSGSNSSSPSLTISYADKQDQGAYTCIATNEDGTGNSSATFLVVRGPPTVTVPQSSYSVIIGRSVTLTCNVISDLDITSVTWRRITENNSEPLFITVLPGEMSSSKYSGSNSSSPSLTISYADKQDQGAYTCIATNEDGTGNSSATFLVVKNTYTNCNKNVSDIRLHTMLPVGYCLDHSIVCHGKDDTGQKIEIKNIVKGVEFIDVKTKPEVDNQTGFDLCVNRSLKDVSGLYQLILTVSIDDSQEMNLKWNVEVEKSRCILNSSYEVEVLEYESVGSVVLHIDSCAPNYYTILSSIAEQSDEEISFTTDYGYGYIITSPLNTDISTLYKFLLVMTENTIVLQTVNVTIAIVDSSQRPLCPLTINIYISLLDVEGKTGYKVICSSYNNRSIAYAVSGTDYFEVLSSGEIHLISQLPRYFDIITYFNIVVRYDGNPQHSETVGVVVHLNKSISAVCSPIKTLPAVWILNACVKIDMNCSDPTQTDSTHLQYSLDFIELGSQAFTIDELSNGVYNLCYHLNESMRYQLAVTVSNDLLDYRAFISLEVEYEDTTPQFTYASYSKDIPENIPVGYSVTTIPASVRYGELSFSIQGQESIPVFEITKTGVILTILSLRPYTNVTMQFKVQAMNVLTGLTASADVNVFILDVDDPPSCEVTGFLPLLPVDSPVGTIIVNFTCIDPDVVQEYIRELDAHVEMEKDEEMSQDILKKDEEKSQDSLKKDEEMSEYNFKKDDSNFEVKFLSKGRETTGSILTKTPLPVDIPMYNITGIVREKISPESPRYNIVKRRQPVYRETFVVNVNLTPPDPSFDAYIISPTKIQVRWGFTRLEFYNITEWYIISWNENEENGSVNRFSEIQQYTLTVEEDKVYRVQVKVKTKYGLLVTPIKTVKTPEIPIYSSFIASFKLQDKEFVPELNDKSSSEYTELSQSVKTDVESELNKTSGFVSVEVLQFRTGSVIVDTSITVNQTGSVLENSAVLKSAIASGYLGQLSVEPWSYSITEGNGKLQVGLSVNGPFYEDAALTFTCTADIIGNVGQTSVTWTLNNVVLRPTSKSRWRIMRLQPNQLMPFRVEYQISVDPLKVGDSGSLSCSVTDGYLQSSRSIQMQVLGKPTVSIFPLTAVVKQGETTTVQCTVTSNPTEVRDIQWYKNGYMFDGSQDEVIDTDIERTSELLTIINIQKSVLYGCVGTNEAGEGPKVRSNITVYVEGENLGICPVNVDRFGTVWEETIDGIIVTKPCTGNQTGDVSRVCNDGVWAEPDYSTCVLTELVSLVEETDRLTEGAEREVVDDILKKLTNLTQRDIQLTSGDLTAASNTLLGVSDHAKERVETVSSDQLEDFVEAANNILYDEKKEDWNQLKTKQQTTDVTTLLKAVQNYNDAYSQSQDQEFITIIQKENIVVEVGKIQNEDITFPDRTQLQPSWITKTKTTIKLQQSSLTGNQPFGFGTAYYRNISDLFPTYLLKNRDVQDIEGSIEVNSDVVDFSISPPLPYINPPLVIQFEYLTTGLTKPVCGFWDFNLQAWSTVGSRLTKASDDLATCEYDHTTNFALLMSPMGTKETGHEKSLSYISAAGCGISILFLAITLTLYFRNWRRIRSDKAKILVNLCIALILSYALFLCLWAPLSDIRGLCVTIAVLLHYIFLVDFTSMSAMAIEIGIQVLYILPTKSRVKWLIPSCWVVPAVIVGISMGATQLEGYGDSDVCWLSVDKGLIWAFIGPALVIVLVNLVILALVIRTLFRSMGSKAGRSNQSKSTLEKTKTGARSICVLAPLFGVTWVFGVLSMSKDLVAFQYLFAIFNSLQGFFIFIFHCLMDKRVNEAIKHRNKKKKTSRFDSFSNTVTKTRLITQTSFTEESPETSPKKTNSSVLNTNELEKPYDKDLNNNLNNNLPGRKLSLLNNFVPKNQSSPIGQQMIGRQSASKNLPTPANQQEGYNPCGLVQSPMRLSPGHQPTTPWQPNTADIGTI
ncbi:uncharacterized protein LOC134688340 [Mytilus trossulus]|uniref:uncharacterized protein LOC134688340 n=1 Tax=Mytilus trossulus TaxID=6551 RepID=UPI00300660C0